MDIDYLLSLQSLRSITHQVFNSLFLFTTTFGEDFIIMSLISGIYWCVRKQSALYLLFNFHLGNFINQAIKITVCAYRPWIRDSRITPVDSARPGASGYSFPSGHTAKAMAVWGGLAVYDFKRNKPLASILLLIILAVGFSRNYLGVHTPQDVLVSLILGGFILYGTYYLLIWADKKRGRDWITAGSTTLASILLVFYAKNKSYPLDYIDGQLLVNPQQMINGCFRGCGGIIGLAYGWVLDRKLIHYNEARGTWQTKLYRYLLGMIGLTLLFKTFPSLISFFISPPKAAFINGFIIPFYITAIYPILTRKL